MKGLRLTYLYVYSLGLFHTCKADDAAKLLPNPDLYVPLFNYTVSKRQNFCELQTKFHAGEIELLTAFEGQQLNVAIGDDPLHVNYGDESRSSINTEDLGITIKIFDEIAKRGKFTWKDSFVLEGMPPSGKTWTELLDWSVATYDVSVNYWFDTAERNSMGISFPYGWYDASLIIVTAQDDDSFLTTSVFHPFGWTSPFTGGVWFAIAVTLVVTAMICLFVEGSAAHRGINAPFKSSMISVSFSYIHQVFLNATGHLDISPHTHAGQMVSFSMSFFAMLLFASYTANLASFLVIEKTNMAVQVNTVNDIVQLGKSMCIWGTTAGEEIIRKTFPGSTLVDHFRSDEEVLLGVKEGQCDYAIVSLASYNLFRGMEAVNDDCNLVHIGRSFRSIRAGFATQSDAGTFCTSLVRDMLHAHLRNLQAEGFIDDAWDKHYSQSYDINDEKCFAASVSTTKENSNTLNITNLGGMFLFHGILLAVSFGIYFLERSLRKKGGNTVRDQIVPSKLQHKSAVEGAYLTQRVDTISEKQDEMVKQIAVLTKMFKASMKRSESIRNNPQFSKSPPQDYKYDLSGRDSMSME